MRILVVEDFLPLREAVTQGLVEAGFVVDAAADGHDALRAALEAPYDVIVLDLMLPKLDGLSVLKALRAAASRSHVLILTARDSPNDRVRGLDLGADDYLVKPFAFAELVARVRALVRRKYDVQANAMRIGNLEVDTAARSVKLGGKLVDLSGREYALLEYLAANVNRIVSRADIWHHVYDFNASLESNVVDVYISLLRKKLERPGEARLIHTRRGQGYMLRDGGEGP